MPHAKPTACVGRSRSAEIVFGVRLRVVSMEKGKKNKKKQQWIMDSNNKKYKPNTSACLCMCVCVSGHDSSQTLT